MAYSFLLIAQGFQCVFSIWLPLSREDLIGFLILSHSCNALHRALRRKLKSSFDCLIMPTQFFSPVTWIIWKIMEQCIDVVWKQCAPFFKPIPMPELWWSSQIMDCHGLYIPLISMAQCRSCLFCLFRLIASSPNKLVMMYVEPRDPGQQKYYVTPKLGLKKIKPHWKRFWLCHSKCPGFFSWIW